MGLERDSDTPPNDIRRSSSPLKRKRVSTTDWLQSPKRLQTLETGNQEADLHPQASTVPDVGMTSASPSRRDEDSSTLLKGRETGSTPKRSGKRAISYYDPVERRLKDTDREGSEIRSPENNRPLSSTRRHFSEHHTKHSPAEERDRDRQPLVQQTEQYKMSEHFRTSRNGRVPPNGGFVSKGSGRPTLRDGANQHIPDRAILNRGQPNGRARSHSITTADLHTSIPGPTDSSSSPSEGGAREKLKGALVLFMWEASEQAALQLQRDCNKKALDRRIMDFEKSQSSLTSFPSAMEAQRIAKERAQKEFDSLDAELTKKSQSSFLLIEEIASIVLPEERPSSARGTEHSSGLADPGIRTKIKELDEKFTQHRGDWGIVKNRQQQLDKLYRTSLKTTEERVEELDKTMRDTLTSLEGRILETESKISSLTTKIDQQISKEDVIAVKSEVEGLSSRLDNILKQQPDNLPHSLSSSLAEQAQSIKLLKEAMDNRPTTDLAAKVDNLSSKVESISRQEPGDFTDDFRSTLTKQTQEIKILKAAIDNRAETGLASKVDDLSSRLESIVRQESIEISDELKKTVANQTDDIEVLKIAIDDRSEFESLHSSVKALMRSEGEIKTSLTSLQDHVQAVERELQAASSRLESISQKLKSARNAGGTRGGSHAIQPTLSNEVRESIMREVKATQDAGDDFFGKRMEDQESYITNLHGSFTSLREQYAQLLPRIAADFNGLRDHVNFALTNHTTPNTASIKQLDEKIAGITNEVEGVKVGITALDFRMNNLSTEQVTRQILGQLEGHLRGTDMALPALDVRIQALEMRASGEGASVENTMRREIDRHINTSLQGVKHTIGEVKGGYVKELDALKTQVETISFSLQTVRAGLDSSNAAFTEATNALGAKMTDVFFRVDTVEEDLSSSKTTFEEETMSLRAEIEKVSHIEVPTAMQPPEKRKPDSPQIMRRDGIKRRNPRPSISDSSDEE